MPPNSQNLAEEGAAILAFKLVENGKFQVRFAAWDECLVPDTLCCGSTAKVPYPPPPPCRPNHQAVGGTSDGPTGLQARREGEAPGVSPVWHR